MNFIIAPSDKLAAARARACKVAPFFRYWILLLIPRETPGLGTMAVTQNGIMLWDPAHVAKHSIELLAGDIIHEMLHGYYKHASRLAAIQASMTLVPGVDYANLGNQAGDAAIEDSIGALPRHTWVVTPKSLDLPSGGTVESYFRELVKREETKAKEKAENNTKSEKDDSKEGQPGEGQPGEGQPGEGQPGEGQPGEGQPTPETTHHKCGGCTGHASDIEKDIISKETGRTDTEITRAIRQTSEAIRQEASKNPGSVSGGLAIYAETCLAPPKINWRVKLNKLVRDAAQHKSGMVAQRYSKPSRKQAGMGYGVGRAVLPAMVAPIPRVSVAMDCSGSMCSPDVMAKALTEINGILKAIHAPVDFCTFDTQAGKIVKVKNVQEAKKLFVGGGGTDFCSMFADVTKRRSTDVLIVVTDGYGGAPTVAPKGYKVIWAIINGRSPVKWGSVVEIE